MFAYNILVCHSVSFSNFYDFINIFNSNLLMLKMKIERIREKRRKIWETRKDGRKITRRGK